ncbi:hypothetical protein WJX77_007997 [Trebouxia sp. C0004]
MGTFPFAAARGLTSAYGHTAYARISEYQSCSAQHNAVPVHMTAYVQEGDTVVDATAGNGGDTLWLAKAVGPRGSVFAFDKEEKALAGTTVRIRANISIENMPSMHFHHCCHSLMQDVVALHSASLICFNLGYLPSAEDKPETATEQYTTLAAVAAALKMVNDRGLISIMAYTGHPGGQQEYEAVRQHLQALSPVNWTVSEHNYINRPTAPVLMCVAAKRAL